MNVRTFTSVIHKEEDIYIAECPEVGTASQGYTIEESLANLKEATELYLEDFPLPDVSRPLVTTLRQLRQHKLPRVSAEEAIRSLERLRFVQIRQLGSHLTLKKKLR